MAACAFSGGEAPAPWDLVEAQMWETFGCLPEAGGLDNQDAGRILRGWQCLNTFKAVAGTRTVGDD